ncbi:MAG: ATP-binding protein [Rubrivivax sp.]
MSARDRGPTSGPVSSSVPASALDVVGDVPVRIEDVVDREALTDMCASLHALFGLGVRVYARDGALLASAATELDVCSFVNELAAGRVACASTVSAAKAVSPDDGGEATHPCFTGLAYRVVSLDYEGRRVGRIVLGPYAPAGLDAPPEALARSVPKLDVVTAHEKLARAPRVKPEALARIARHLKTMLELVVFSSHKAYVTSKLHLYSVRESHRELEEKNARLEGALRRLEESDRLRSRFLATVSHELRTPLTSIIGYSEMLAEGIAGPLAAEQAEFVGTIHAKGEQLLGLIMGLLDLSKLDSGTMSLRDGEVRLPMLLEEVISTLTPTARKKNVTLAIEDDGETCELTGDSERLRQVFVNLVDNAVKFTPEGGRVVVRSRVVTAGDGEVGAALLAPLMRAVEVSVADTGIGIPAEERDRVFEAFYQVDSSSTRKYGGAGLGLSIVRRLVEAHDGKVRVEANHPAGAVFVVTLPSSQMRRALPSHVPARP